MPWPCWPSPSSRRAAWVVVRTAVAVQPPNRLDAARSAAAASQVPTSLVDRFGEVLPKGAERAWELSGSAMVTVYRTPSTHPRVTWWSPSAGADPFLARAESVRVWDATTGRKLREIGDPATNFMEIALSPDGSTLATSEEHGGLKLWDLATGREQRRWHKIENEHDVHLAFSPDGQSLAAGVYRHDEASKKDARFIRVWDTATRTEQPAPVWRRLAACYGPEVFPRRQDAGHGERRYRIECHG